MRIGRRLDPFPCADVRRKAGPFVLNLPRRRRKVCMILVCRLTPVSRWLERRGPTASHAEQHRDPLQRLWYWAPTRLGESATAGNLLRTLPHATRDISRAAWGSVLAGPPWAVRARRSG